MMNQEYETGHIFLSFSIYIWNVCISVTDRVNFNSLEFFRTIFFKDLTKGSYSLPRNTFASTSLQFFNIFDKGKRNIANEIAIFGQCN